MEIDKLERICARRQRLLILKADGAGPHAKWVTAAETRRERLRRAAAADADMKAAG